MKITLYIKYLAAMFAGSVLYSCSFLDVVPDDVPVIDHAFGNRYEMERYMYGCFSFLPATADPARNPAFFGCDELWLSERNESVDKTLWGLARGEQGTEVPIYDCWSSVHSGWNLKQGFTFFTAISDCNIFLEHAHLPVDIDESERNQWIANIKFLKAYYHFLLMRQYGAIPVIRENPDITKNDLSIYREPIDDVVDYIVELIDEAVAEGGLPMEITDKANYMGFPTVPIALAVKAQALTWAASPLFNGNRDYADVKNEDGTELFPQTENPQKWVRAADALKEAIDAAHTAGHQLFDFRLSMSYRPTLDERTIHSLQSRAAVVERWNKEIIWGDSRTNTRTLQQMGFPAFDMRHNDGQLIKCLAPPMHIVQQFYTKNGLPIEEDRDWAGIDPLGITVAGNDDKCYIKSGTETINLHMNREPRFYGAISFDGSRYFGNGRINDEKTVWYVGMKSSDPNGGSTMNRFLSTGYQCKKIVHYNSTIPETTSLGLNMVNYSFPIIRLADLYLMYAEALNETKEVPDDDVYEYIDKVRTRSGLKSVVESWKEHALNPNKPLDKIGMRDIIQQERLNELAFEGQRFWDLRRWKLAEKYLTRPIYGLDLRAETVADMYVPQKLYDMKFGPKDYLWPIRQAALTRNPNLVQNFGW